MVKLTLPEILYTFGAFHGVFLAVLLLIKKKSFKLNFFLSLLILLFSFYLVENVIWSSGYLRQLPHFFFTTLPLTFLIGPLYYIYIRSNLDSKFRPKPFDLIHLLPFLFEVAILLPFYTLDASTKVRIYESTRTNQLPGEFNIYFFGFLLYIISTAWYFFQSFRLLETMPSHPKRKWLRTSSIVFCGYLLASLVLTIVSTLSPQTRTLAFHFNLTAQLILIHAIGYVAFLYPELFLPAAEKYKSSQIDNSVLTELRKKLTSILEHDKPYLDSELTPEYFHEKLGITKHQFSQLMTVGMQTTFYDLINSHRIETAKQILLSENYESAKILHVALDSGFSNKSSFLRNFKKITGVTPTEFRSAATKSGSTQLKNTAEALS